jgi:molybdopterin synthase catalytic subunit
MNLTKHILSTIFLLISLQGICQEKIYLDENMKEMDYISYAKKCDAHIYKCMEYKTDTFSINKIMYKHTFGKITPTEYVQVKNILSKDSKEIINKNTIIVVKYSDSLYSYNSTKQKFDNLVIEHRKAVYDTASNTMKYHKINYKNYNLNTYNKNCEKWLKEQNKCIKKFEKIENTNVIYSYLHKEKNTYNYADFNFVKDRGILKNTFFKIVQNFDLLILKPNGEYFLSGGHLDDKKIKKLLKDADWSNYIEDWKTTVTKYPKSGFGFFEMKLNHETHCF